MKIEYISSEDSEDCSASFSIKINGELVASFHDGEPEDNNLMRNFNDIYLISNLIELAYNAGKDGEPLEEIDTEITEK